MQDWLKAVYVSSRHVFANPSQYSDISKLREKPQPQAFRGVSFSPPLPTKTYVTYMILLGLLSASGPSSDTKCMDLQRDLTTHKHIAAQSGSQTVCYQTLIQGLTI